MLLEHKGILSGSSDTSIDRQREAILVRGARTPMDWTLREVNGQYTDLEL